MQQKHVITKRGEELYSEIGTNCDDPKVQILCILSYGPADLNEIKWSFTKNVSHVDVVRAFSWLERNGFVKDVIQEGNPSDLVTEIGILNKHTKKSTIWDYGRHGAFVPK